MVQDPNKSLLEVYNTGMYQHPMRRPFNGLACEYSLSEAKKLPQKNEEAPKDELVNLPEPGELFEQQLRRRQEMEEANKKKKKVLEDALVKRYATTSYKYTHTHTHPHKYTPSQAHTPHAPSHTHINTAQVPAKSGRV